MTRQEFVNWLENESCYKLIEKGKDVEKYEQGLYRTLYLYADGTIETMLLSPIEYCRHNTRVEDLVRGEANSLKFKVTELDEEGKEVEDEYYLFSR